MNYAARRNKSLVKVMSLSALKSQTAESIAQNFEEVARAIKFHRTTIGGNPEFRIAPEQKIYRHMPGKIQIDIPGERYTIYQNGQINKQ